MLKTNVTKFINLVLDDKVQPPDYLRFQTTCQLIDQAEQMIMEDEPIQDPMLSGGFVGYSQPTYDSEVKKEISQTGKKILEYLELSDNREDCVSMKEIKQISIQSKIPIYHIRFWLIEQNRPYVFHLSLYRNMRGFCKVKLKSKPN